MQRAAMTTVDLKELWFIHGRAYDLTSFLKAHPGKAQET
jgi:cytochrome b involved in lipid metabolism